MRLRAGPSSVAGTSLARINALTSTFAGGWAGVKNIRVFQVFAAALGLAGPLAIGALAGHARIWMAASLGGLALSGGGKGETLREQALSMIYSLAAGGAAMVTGSSLAGHDILTAFGTPVMAAVAGLFGGISRPLARAATQFILFAVIAANLGPKDAHPMGAMLLFCLGAIWTAGLSLGLRTLFRAMRLGSHTHGGLAQTHKYSAGQLVRRWRKSLARLSGWQYVLRITPCLIAAGVFDWIWPHHHGYWVSITVVIVVQRRPQAALTRTLHRAVGTTFGVLLTGVLMLCSLDVWSMIAVIAGLAAMRIIFLEVNYTAYAAVMTPLVILLLDFGQEPTWIVVTDRLVATLAGCGLAMTLGYVGWSGISFPSRIEAGRGGPGRTRPEEPPDGIESHRRMR